MECHPILLEPIFAFDEGELLREDGSAGQVGKELFEKQIAGRPLSFCGYFLDCSKRILRKPGDTSISTSLGILVRSFCRAGERLQKARVNDLHNNIFLL